LKNANGHSLTCSAFKENIRAYVDEELPVNIRSAFLEHASQCEICALELKEMQNVRKMIARLRRIMVSPEYDFRLKLSIRREYENLRNPFYVFKLFISENLFKLLALPAIGVAVALSVMSYNYIDRNEINHISSYEISTQINAQNGVELVSGNEDSSIGEEKYILETVKPLDVERGVFLNDRINSFQNVSSSNVVFVTY